VCVNEDLAASICNLGVPESRVVVLPAYLPASIDAVTIPEDLHHWLSLHQPLLSTALSFKPEYGFEVLVNALDRLAEVYPAMGCLVMGDGEGRMDAELLVQDRGLREKVKLVGDVEHETCVALMARSDVFVRPTFQDGDSISVREAGSAGVPVVASNVGRRPRGRLLFATGVGEYLARKIRYALETVPMTAGQT
jgi:glycosyltransferase involved in cell wall biosynthesis